MFGSFKLWNFSYHNFIMSLLTCLVILFVNAVIIEEVYGKTKLPINNKKKKKEQDVIFINVLSSNIYGPLGKFVTKGLIIHVIYWYWSEAIGTCTYTISWKSFKSSINLKRCSYLDKVTLLRHLPKSVITSSTIYLTVVKW